MIDDRVSVLHPTLDSKYIAAETDTHSSPPKLLAITDRQTELNQHNINNEQNQHITDKYQNPRKK